MDTSHSLESLAGTRFPDLTEGEIRTLNAASKGELVVCGPI
jgi:hypothetical protein